MTVLLMGVGSGGQGEPWPPWIFIYGTNIVDRGFKSAIFWLFLLFFDLFSVGPTWKMLNSVIFWYFLLIFGLFSVAPPGKFSAYTLSTTCSNICYLSGELSSVCRTRDEQIIS